MALDLQPGWPVRMKITVPGVTGFGAGAEVVPRFEWVSVTFLGWDNGYPVVRDKDGKEHKLHSRNLLDY